MKKIEKSRLRRYELIKKPFVGLNNNYDIHFDNIIKMYNNAYPYIKTLPCFHVGYFYATEKLIELADKYGFTQKKSLIDLCCGIGGSMRYIYSKYKFDIVGIDINSKLLEFCNSANSKKSNKITTQQANVLHYNSGKVKYDIVWSEDSFSHIPNKDKLFKNCYSILRDNGLLVFSDLIRTESLSVKEHRTFCKAWSLDPLETVQSYLSLLKRSGFKILEVMDSNGVDLIRKHLEIDVHMLRDSLPSDYISYLKTEKNQLIKIWGEQGYKNRIEKMKMYPFLKDEKLDYLFVVAKKNYTINGKTN
jgi:2-polyprenyl-3-methyl-5-hydroxy-6-metoxy-1,4-benzoquinol methylase